MSQRFLEHIEELKVYLDSMSNPETMKVRLEAIEAALAIEKGDQKPPTRAHMLNEASFMLKSKDRIMKAVAPEKYLEVFSKIVSFLENNPPEKKPKKKKVSKDLKKEVKWSATIGVDEYPMYELPTPRWEYTTHTITYDSPPQPEVAEIIGRDEAPSTGDYDRAEYTPVVGHHHGSAPVVDVVTTEQLADVSAQALMEALSVGGPNAAPVAWWTMDSLGRATATSPGASGTAAAPSQAQNAANGAPRRR